MYKIENFTNTKNFLQFMNNNKIPKDAIIKVHFNGYDDITLVYYESTKNTKRQPEK